MKWVVQIGRDQDTRHHEHFEQHFGLNQKEEHASYPTLNRTDCTVALFDNFLGQLVFPSPSILLSATSTILFCTIPVDYNRLAALLPHLSAGNLPERGVAHHEHEDNAEPAGLGLGIPGPRIRACSCGTHDASFYSAPSSHLYRDIVQILSDQF